jgi:hypothetical protein
MVQWQLHDREWDDDDSPTTTMNGAFGGGPIFILFEGRLWIAQWWCNQYCRLDSMNLPMQVQALQEGRCKSTGGYEIATW